MVIMKRMFWVWYDEKIRFKAVGEKEKKNDVKRTLSFWRTFSYIPGFNQNRWAGIVGGIYKYMKNNKSIITNKHEQNKKNKQQNKNKKKPHGKKKIQ